VHEGVPTKFSFEAINSNSFDVDVELDVPGHLHSQSHSLPFKHHLKSGHKAHLGWVSSSSDIEPTWSWAEVASNNTKTKVSHHDAKGVIMTQTQVYKENEAENQLQMNLRNTHHYPVEVEINFTGDGTVDLRGLNRPILLRVNAQGIAEAGTVHFTGEINVDWKWVQME